MKKEQEPLITTIIPTYQRPHLIARAIRSVQQQTYGRVTILVCDNASQDHTEAVVRELQQSDPRIVYHRHVENIGSAANFQFGLQQVATPFFSFLSDDDVLLPSFYERAITALEHAPEVGLFVGSTLSCDEQGRILKAVVENWPREGLFLPSESCKYMGSENSPLWTGILFRSSILKKIGELDLTVGGCIDTEFQLRAAAHFPLIVNKTPCALFVCHSSSITGNLRARAQNYPFTGMRVGFLDRPALMLDPATKDELHAKEQRAMEINLFHDMKTCLQRRYFKDFWILYAGARTLYPRRARSLLWKYYIRRYMPFLYSVWDRFKRCRRKIKSRILGRASTLDRLEATYGNYAAYLQN